MPYCSRNGVKSYYEVSGEGYPFVFMHANPFDRRMFLYQAAHFSTYFKVINIDLRAYGYSDKPATPITMTDLCEDVVAVCRQEGAKEAIFAGVSVGGVMGLQLGLDHPEIFKALVLVGCSSMPGDRYQSRIDGYMKQGLDRFHIQHLTDLVSKDFAQSKRGKYLLGMHTEMDARLSAPAIAEIFNALQDRDLTARLPELKMPVLIMNGEFDNSLKRSKEMSTRIAGAEHHVIPGAGHACCLEDPATFDDYVLTFLKQHGFFKGEASNRLEGPVSDLPLQDFSVIG
ncbi:MAG TPA: alpha/beta hydrolase [Candidatus Saccharimonadales bacterium]|nr:alpha/beta hydrolase [Candidatus Saccharimonadales bacterium]